MPTDRKLQQVLLTFPRWPSTPLTTFNLMLPPSSYMKICEEKHDDTVEGKSDLHYHVVYRPEHPITKKKLLIYLMGKYPDDWKRIDIEGIKCWSKAVSYLSKESLTTLEFGEDKKTAGRLSRKPYTDGDATRVIFSNIAIDLYNRNTYRDTTLGLLQVNQALYEGYDDIYSDMKRRLRDASMNIDKITIIEDEIYAFINASRELCFLPPIKKNTQTLIPFITE